MPKSAGGDVGTRNNDRSIICCLNFPRGNIEDYWYICRSNEISLIMKYIVRAVKYFLYVVCIVSLIMFILVQLGYISSDINIMFRNGWKSVWLILGVFAGVSAIYPKMGYGRRQAAIPGEYSEIRAGIISYMEEHGYKLEKEEGENLSFRSSSAVKRLLRVWEDRITMERSLGGFSMEGPVKDLVRVVGGLEYRFRQE